MYIFVSTYLPPIQDTYTWNKSSHSKIDIYKKNIYNSKNLFETYFCHVKFEN
jgi:hypothetical protein